MKYPENDSLPENNPDKLIYRDLVDHLTYAFDDAFASVRSQKGRGIAEFVQVDTHSLRYDNAFSILLTESGGKPDRGVEKLRLLARPTRPDVNVEEAAAVMGEAEELVFRTDEYFIAHQSRNGEFRFCRVDEEGIYPWIPSLQDIVQDGDQLTFDELSIVEFLRRPTQQDIQLDQDFNKINITYAKELVEKVDQWLLVPQN